MQNNLYSPQSHFKMNPKVMRGLVEERDLAKTIEYPPCGYSAVLKYSYQQLELLRPIQLCCFKIYCICVGIR